MMEHRFFKIVIKHTKRKIYHFHRFNEKVSLFWASWVVKNPPANEGDLRDSESIPGLGKSPGGGHGNPLQYSCLENPHGQRILEGYSLWGRKVGENMVGIFMVQARKPV